MKTFGHTLTYHTRIFNQHTSSPDISSARGLRLLSQYAHPYCPSSPRCLPFTPATEVGIFLPANVKLHFNTQTERLLELYNPYQNLKVSISNSSVQSAYKISCDRRQPRSVLSLDRAIRLTHYFVKLYKNWQWWESNYFSVFSSKTIPQIEHISINSNTN